MHLCDNRSFFVNGFLCSYVHISICFLKILLRRMKTMAISLWNYQLWMFFLFIYLHYLPTIVFKIYIYYLYKIYLFFPLEKWSWKKCWKQRISYFLSNFLNPFSKLPLSYSGLIISKVPRLSPAPTWILVPSLSPKQSATHSRYGIPKNNQPHLYY